MSKYILEASGIGDVPAYLAYEGLELARIYFEDNNIDPAESYSERNKNPKSELAQHWDKAEKISNRVLLSDERYDNSMISLEIEEE